MIWETELLTRADKSILVLRLNGETRGSLSLETEAELQAWQEAVKWLNERSKAQKS